MSGTLRRDCFWMSIIKSNPGDEFYCEAPDTDECYFNCDNCEWFITRSDMQCIFLHIVDLFREFLPKKSEPIKHGRWNKVVHSNNHTTYYCSECGSIFNKGCADLGDFNYCPNCGIPMNKDEEDL